MNGPSAPRVDSWTIEARHSEHFFVRKGQVVRLIDVAGEQVADVCFVTEDDRDEGMSGIATTQMNGTVALTTGHRLFTGRNRAAFTIVADAAGPHDVLMGACSRDSYLQRYGVADHPNCQDLLTEAFARAGVTRIVSDTFNAFMNVPVAPDGSLSVQRPRSRPGDVVELRAELDCLVVVSACPADLSPCNGFNPTAIGVELS